MGLFSKKKKHQVTKRQVATFIANDADIAYNFMKDVIASDDHEYDIDEVSTDHFALFFVFNDISDRDGDFEDCVRRLGYLKASTLSLQGIFSFKVEVGEQEVNLN